MVLRTLSALMALVLLCGLIACTPADTTDADPTTTTTTTATSATTTTTTTATTTTTTTTSQMTTTTTKRSGTQAPMFPTDISGYAPTYHAQTANTFFTLAERNKDGRSVNKETEALLDAYFTYRCLSFAKAQAQTVTAPEALSISDVVRTQEETQRVDGLKRLQTMWDCHFSGAQVLYTIDRVRTSDNLITLRIHEAVYFYNWYEGYTTPEKADLSGYGLRHIIRIRNGVIESDHYNEGAPTRVAIEGRLDDEEYWSYAGKEGNPADKTDSPIITVPDNKPNYVETYDPIKAVAYAREWAMSRNRDYFKDYHTSGGDCANFTSQCMSYGGLPHSDDWWWRNGNTGKGGYAWKTATGMYRYLTKTAKVGKAIAMIECIDETGRTARYNGQVVPATELFYVGSPVFYRWKGGFAEDGEWSHATFCVGVLGDGTPTISCHTEDRYNFKWTYGGLTCEYSCVQLTPENPYQN